VDLVKKEGNTTYLHSGGSKTPRGLHSRGTRNINAILILKSILFYNYLKVMMYLHSFTLKGLVRDEFNLINELKLRLVIIYLRL